MIRIWVEKKGAGEILAASSDKIWLVQQGKDKTGKKACPPSVFEQKNSFADKSSEKEGWSPWGSGWKNSDPHPEAVPHPLDRACPGEIRRGRWFCSVFPLELFPRWPLLAEEREKGSSKITTRRA
jgi:hypothetical protein